MPVFFFDFSIGFLEIRLWDILDIAIVGFIIFQVYKLLRGTVAFNIFIGIISLFVLWWLVQALEMDLLSSILNQFASLGVIILIIIFQPEIRRFFAIFGRTTVKGRLDVFRRIFSRQGQQGSVESEKYVRAVSTAMRRLSRTKTGALLVIAPNAETMEFSRSGVTLNAVISTPLLVSIFNHHGPLHDGAVVLSANRVHAAGCILPVSNNPTLPGTAGLRHRAGLGVTEGTNVATFIVSEETGKMAYAREGKIRFNVKANEIDTLLSQAFREAQRSIAEPSKGGP